MAITCNTTPLVHIGGDDTKGKEASILYTDLQHFVRSLEGSKIHPLAIDLYKPFASTEDGKNEAQEKFKQDMFKDDYEHDENGEPTLYAVIYQSTVLDDIFNQAAKSNISKETICQRFLARKYKLYAKDGEIKINYYDSKKLESFLINLSNFYKTKWSENFRIIPIVNEDTAEVTAKIVAVKDTKENEEISSEDLYNLKFAERFLFNRAVEKQVVKIFTQVGFTDYNVIKWIRDNLNTSFIDEKYSPDKKEDKASTSIIMDKLYALSSFFNGRNLSKEQKEILTVKDFQFIIESLDQKDKTHQEKLYTLLQGLQRILGENKNNIEVFAEYLYNTAIGISTDNLIPEQYKDFKKLNKIVLSRLEQFFSQETLTPSDLYTMTINLNNYNTFHGNTALSETNPLLGAEKESTSEENRYKQKEKEEMDKIHSFWHNLMVITKRRNEIYKKRRYDSGTNYEEKKDIVVNQENLVTAFEEIITQESKKTENNPSRGSDEDLATRKINALKATMQNATLDLSRLSDLLTSLRKAITESDHTQNANHIASQLRMIKDYISSYTKLLEGMRPFMNNKLFSDKDLVKNSNISYIDKLHQTTITLTELRNIFSEQMDTINNTINSMLNEYQLLAAPVFREYLTEMLPEGAVLQPTGEGNNVSELVDNQIHDINFMTRWVNSLANTNDDMAKLYSHIIKTQKQQARLDTDKIRQIINGAAKLLNAEARKEGSHKTYHTHDFMFEKEVVDGQTVIKMENGLAHYITGYDMQAYKEALAKMLEDSKEIENETDRYAKQQEWYDEHYPSINGTRIPSTKYFPSKEYLALSKPERKFFDTFMSVKASLDRSVPGGIGNLQNAIYVKKGFWEKFLYHNNGHEFWSNMKDSFHEIFSIRSSDDEFGESSNLKDFSGEKVQKIPIYYTYKSKDAPITTFSLDVVSSMSAYAMTVNNYKAMNQVSSILELGMDLIKQRKIYHKKSPKQFIKEQEDGLKNIQALADIEDNTLDNAASDVSKNRLVDRLRDALDAQVYGQIKKRGTSTIQVRGYEMNITHTKLLELLTGYVALKTTAINLFVGATNLMQGFHQISLAMISCEFFTPKDFLKAQKQYFSDILWTVADSAGIVQHGKLSLFNSKFDVLQDFESAIHDTDYGAKSSFKILVTKNPLYLLSSMGEHYMQTCDALAIANHDKVKTADGKLISIYDAFERVWNDPDDHMLGATLQLRTDTTFTYQGKTIISNKELEQRKAKKDMELEIKYAPKVQKRKIKDAQYGKVDKLYSSPVVNIHSQSLIDKQTEIGEDTFIGNVSRKMGKVNQDLHGIYNQVDRNALQALAVGGFLMMYRKHIAPNFMARWKKKGYDYDLGKETTGFQRLFMEAAWKSLQACFTVKQKDDNGVEHIVFSFNFAKHPGQTVAAMVHAFYISTPEQRISMAKNLTNFTKFLLNAFLLRLLDSDDGDDNEWLMEIYITLLYRSRAEMSFFTMASFFSEYNAVADWCRILQNPIIGMSSFVDLFNLFRLLAPNTWIDEVPSGKNKGQKEAWVIVKNALPGYRQISSLIDPESTQSFYK